MNLSRFPEWRILGFLGIIALSIYLLSIFGSFLAIFADIFLILFLSWILAFILEPFVTQLSAKSFPRVWAAATIYLILAIITIILIWVAIPATVTQFSQAVPLLSQYFPENSVWAIRLENFLTSLTANFAPLATGVASTATSLLLVFILSFYVLISREEISQFILRVIPEAYKSDYRFLENVLNTTFATFLRVQALMGAFLGLLVFLTLFALGINYSFSTAVIAAILAFIPVVGPIIFLLPVILATLTVSLQKMFIAVIIIVIAAQIVYNVWAPKLLGTALKIHPIIILISFLVGYKIAGVWGAVFSVPVISALVIIIRDLLLYWKEEADRR